MDYTVRFAHLENRPLPFNGTIFQRGDVIGKMGSTGQSTGPHLHIDCVVGKIKVPWHQSDCEEYMPMAAYRQLLYFIDDELFGVPLIVTTPFCDIDYFLNRGKVHKVHMGFDVVPNDRMHTDKHFNIRWNRSMTGTIIAAGFDAGYGNYIHVAFTA